MLRNSYASCLGLSSVSQLKVAKNKLKQLILGVQGRSMSSMLVARKARQQCLLW